MTVDQSSLEFGTPALATARILAAGLHAEITPVCRPGDDPPSGSVLLADRDLSDELLAAIAGHLTESSGLVLWFPGSSGEEVADRLGPHGFDHGALIPVDVPERGVVAVIAPDEKAAAEHDRLLAVRQRPVRALAIMPVYNEADVVYHAVGSLISHGLDVYVLDHRSTDGTPDVLRPWLGRGLLRIERFPDECGYNEANESKMVWREILRRVQEVAEEVPADWHLFVNADEFREAPWPGTTLGEGLREVQDLGFNAVNFELVNFMPTPGDEFVPGDDVRRHLHHYEPPGSFDLLQIKAWNSGGQAVDIVSHAGHDVQFPGRRVFGVPFILRHYPIRSLEHGRQKVLAERLARFDERERADGWHVQYDHYVDDKQFLRDREDCGRWDGQAFRAELLSRSLRQQLLVSSLLPAADLAAGFAPQALVAWIERRGLADVSEAEIAQALELLQFGLSTNDPRLSEVAAAVAQALEAQATMQANMVLASKLRGVLSDAA
jgi:hypothetical protein